MVRTKVMLLILVAVLLCGCASHSKGPKTAGNLKQESANELTSVSVDVLDNKTEVRITSTRKPVYSVYRMSDPQRLLVDMADCTKSGVKALEEVNDGLLNVITTNQYQSKGKTITRVMIGFERNAEFTAREDEKSLTLSLMHPEGYEPIKTAEVGKSPAVVENTGDSPPTSAAALPPASICSSTEPQVVIPYGGKHSKVKIRAISIVPTEKGVALKLRAKGRVRKGSIEVLRLCEPDRLIVDMYGARNEMKTRKIAGDGNYIGQIRLGRHKKKLRMVLDLERAIQDFDLEVKKRGLVLALSKGTEANPEASIAVAAVQNEGEKPKAEARKEEIEPADGWKKAENEEAVSTKEGTGDVSEKSKPKPALAVRMESVKTGAQTAPVVAEIAPSEEKKEKAEEKTPVVEESSSGLSNRILGLDFKHRPSFSTIEVRMTEKAEYRLEENGEDQYVLELTDVELPEHLEQSLDTSEFDGPITLISSYLADPQEKLVKVVVQTRYHSPNRIRMEDGKLLWAFERKEEIAAEGSAKGRISLNSSGETVIEYEPGEAAGMAGSLAPINQAATGVVPQGKGQRISLELKNTDILDVLRLIADVSKLNIITSDDVGGTVTVRLLNVPWQQALEIILRSKGLGQERQGNIIRVAPLSVLQAEREMRINQIKAQRELEPVSVRLIPVSYSSASDLLQKVKDLLSTRGTVNFDDRTNVIIVKDIEEVLSKAESLVSKLDLQTPQVMIEAKIVEADVTNELAYGIQWGGYYIMSEKTGNPTGLSYPSSFGIAGAQDYNSKPGLPNDSQPPNWVVNVPTTTSPAMGLGMTFGNAQNTHNLSLRLTALESSGKIKIISSPRISTLDNTEANIEQGLQIPIMGMTVTGVPVSKMVKATLELKVTPHITADGSIIMKLEITKEEPDFSRTNALGDPAIIKKSANTEVLVRTGETTVIGGIYTKKTSVKESGVPGLMNIPILGYLFKNRSTASQRTELLIFITPRIINRAQSSLTVD